MKRTDFNKIITKLKRKFQLVEVGTDHVDYDVYMKGKLITTVRSSRSPKDWDEQLVARNLHISKTDLNEFKQCHLSNENLIVKIKNKNMWPLGI